MDFILGSRTSKISPLSGLGVYSLPMFVSQHPMFLLLTNIPSEGHILSVRVNNFIFQTRP